MDEYEEQIKLQAIGKLHHRCHFLKRTLQLVLSVALLSFFLCHSSGFSLFPHSFNVYFSTLLFSFFTRSLERKYMFLICNGILAFLAKSSVSSSSDLGAQMSTSSTNLTQMKASSVTNEVVLRFSDNGDYDESLVAEGEEAEDTDNNEAEEQAEKENESVGREEEEEEEEEREREVSVIVEDEGYKEGESGLVIQEEQEDEGVGAPVAANEEEPSTEELNRKIEEFIRKMKEEIRIEAQQQLIAV